MRPTESDVKAWRALHLAWQSAFQEARLARAVCTQALVKCVQGAGAGPTLEELGEAERLEKVAERLAAEMDQFLANMKN